MDPPDRGGRARRGLWAIWFAIAMWFGPWYADIDELTAARDTGTLREYAVVADSPADAFSGSGTLFASRTLAPHTWTEPASIVVWRDASGRRRWTDGQLVPAAAAAYFDHRSVAEALREWIGPQRAAQSTSSAVPRKVVVALGALWAMGLASIRFLAPPRRGSSWFWFWMFGTTGAAGFLGYIVAECFTHPAEASNRWGGWAGVGMSVVGSTVLAWSFGVPYTIWWDHD